jgi:hypothetical protein
MYAYLNSFTVCGVKNISKPVTLCFHNKTFSPSPLKRNPVKAVYGVNGAGKTALMLGVSIFKGLLTNSDYLAVHQRMLDDIICFSKKSFEAKASFALVEEGSNLVKNLFEYSIAFLRNENGYRIHEEKLSLLGHSTLFKEPQLIFACEDGVLKTLTEKADPKYAEALRESTKNTLSKSSLLSLHPTLEAEKIVLADDPHLFSLSLLSLFVFANAIEVHLFRQDVPSEPYSLEPNYFAKIIGDNTPLSQAFSQNQNASYDIIRKEELAAYHSQSQRIASFIRLFKPGLRDIEEDIKDANENAYMVQRYFVYGPDCRVNSYLESTGVKSIVSLFSFLDRSSKGSIVFIDEMDANINGVYLQKLVSFLTKYAKGQLCFTSHNTLPMAVLEKEKFGLDFLSPDSYLVSWKRNGNYSAESQYTEGFVPGMAFNLIEEDFLPIFPPEEKSTLPKNNEGKER